MNIGSILQAVGSFAGLAFVGLLVLMISRAGRNQGTKSLGPITILVLIVAILFTTIGSGLVFLQANEYGVVITPFQPNGYRTVALTPGLHWIIPFFENVQKYSVARQTYTCLPQLAKALYRATIRFKPGRKTDSKCSLTPQSFMPLILHN